MNSVILNALVPAATSQADAKARSSTNDSAPGGETFGFLLSGKLSAKSALSKSSPAVQAGDAKQTALEAKIAKLLKAGASEAEISSTLAAQLSDSVAQALGITTADARAQLQAVFAGALAPPGDGELAHGSLSERSRALAQRFLKVETLANTVIDGRMGQQNRIAGHFLDATSAKESPAPTPASTNSRLEPHSEHQPVRHAVDVGSSLILPTTAAAVSGQTGLSTLPGTYGDVAAGAALDSRVNVPVSSDGRSVKFDTRPASAGGGSTVLGRVLTRALLAADARAQAVPAQPASSDKAVLTLGEEQTNATAAPPDSAISLFVKNFEAALGTGTHLPRIAQPQSAGAAASLPLALTGHATANVPVAFMPVVAPLIIERTAPPVAPAPLRESAPADQSAIVDQVLRGAFMRNTGESSELRLSLVPENLGDVTVKLVVSGGNVSAHVVAETPDVRDALVAAQPQLAKSLADSGLKLQSFTVDLSGNGFAGFSQQQGQSQNGNRARQSPLSDDESFDDVSLDATPSFAPSMTATSRAGDYNYLA